MPHGARPLDPRVALPHQTPVGTRRCRHDERINDVPSEATHPPHGGRGRQLDPRPHGRLLGRRGQRTTRQRRRHPLGGDQRPDLAHRPRRGRHVRQVRRGVQEEVPRGHRRQGRGRQGLRGHRQDADEHRRLRRRPRHPRARSPPTSCGDFFEPLGDQAEMAKEYRWINDKSFEGKSYGIPVVGNVQGILYNKRVWEEAGITEFPTTPQEFLDDLQAIKDKGVAKVAPLYTNYKDSLGALAVGRLARGRHGGPGRRQQDDADGHAVDRRVRLRRHRRHDLRRRRAGPHRGRPDHHRLGGLQADDRRRRHRDDGARLVGDPADGRGRRGRGRGPRGHRLHADPGAGRRQVPHGGRRRLQPRHQRALEEQGDRPRVDRLVQPRLGLLRVAGRPLAARRRPGPGMRSRASWTASSSSP